MEKLIASSEHVGKTAQDWPPVSPAEAGQKLMRFLERRTGLSQSVLHRWIRTGQIRRNGHRCKPFMRLEAGDQIRLPPGANGSQPKNISPLYLPPLPPLLSQDGEVWAFNKPAGLAVQGGTGQRDSLCERLKKHFAASPFVPAPAHRLDRDTTGVLLVGAAYKALRQLHDWFARNEIHKEYLCWVTGYWKAGSVLLRHWLIDQGGIVALKEEHPGSRLALSFVRPIAVADQFSLLHVKLRTGRKRQIRAQLAACGHPIVGDARYAGQISLKLHCARMILPNGREFSCLPPWEGKFALDSLPPLLKNSIV